SVQKLGDFGISGNEASGFLLGDLNPSATLATRVHRAEYAEGDLESPDGCLNKIAFESRKYDNAGDELKVRDMSTAEERVVYRNLHGKKGPSMNLSRVKNPPRWVDDNRIAFITAQGVYEIDAQGGNARLIATPDPLSHNAGLRAYTRLVGANDAYLFTNN